MTAHAGAMKPPRGRESGAQHAEPWRGQPKQSAPAGAPVVTLRVAWSWEPQDSPALPKGRPRHPGQPQPLGSAGGTRAGALQPLPQAHCQPCEASPGLQAEAHPEDEEPELGAGGPTLGMNLNREEPSLEDSLQSELSCYEQGGEHVLWTGRSSTRRSLARVTVHDL